MKHILAKLQLTNNINPFHFHFHFPFKLDACEPEHDRFIAKYCHHCDRLWNSELIIHASSKRLSIWYWEEGHNWWRGGQGRDQSEYCEEGKVKTVAEDYQIVWSIRDGFNSHVYLLNWTCLVIFSAMAYTMLSQIQKFYDNVNFWSYNLTTLTIETSAGQSL